MAGAAALQEKFTQAVGKFQELQKKYQKVAQNRSQLDAQLTENKIVIEELDLLEDGANVYKLIGPALVKQDLTEARDNVRRRIKYLEDQIKSHDSEINQIEKQMDQQKEAINKLQTQLQAAKAPPAAAAMAK